MKQSKLNALMERFGFTDYLKSYKWYEDKKTYHVYQFSNGNSARIEVDEDGYFVITSRVRGEYEIACLETETDVTKKLCEIMES